MNSSISSSTPISRRALFAGAGALSISIADAGSVLMANADEALPKATVPSASQTMGADSWLAALALQLGRVIGGTRAAALAEVDHGGAVQTFSFAGLFIFSVSAIAHHQVDPAARSRTSLRTYRVVDRKVW